MYLKPTHYISVIERFSSMNNIIKFIKWSLIFFFTIMFAYNIHENLKVLFKNSIIVVKETRKLEDVNRKPMVTYILILSTTGLKYCLSSQSCLGILIFC